MGEHRGWGAWGARARLLGGVWGEGARQVHAHTTHHQASLGQQNTGSECGSPGQQRARVVAAGLPPAHPIPLSCNNADGAWRVECQPSSLLAAHQSSDMPKLNCVGGDGGRRVPASSASLRSAPSAHQLSRLQPFADLSTHHQIRPVTAPAPAVTRRRSIPPRGCPPPSDSLTHTADAPCAAVAFCYFIPAVFSFDEIGFPWAVRRWRTLNLETINLIASALCYRPP